jgi:hypothetical protein
MQDGVVHYFQIYSKFRLALKQGFAKKSWERSVVSSDGLLWGWDRSRDRRADVKDESINLYHGPIIVRQRRIPAKKSPCAGVGLATLAGGAGAVLFARTWAFKSMAPDRFARMEAEIESWPWLPCPDTCYILSVFYF